MGYTIWSYDKQGRVIMGGPDDDGRPSNEQVYDQLSHYVELNGMTQLLKDAGLLLEVYPFVRLRLKDRFPQQANQITLWEKLHGV